MAMQEILRKVGIVVVVSAAAGYAVDKTILEANGPSRENLPPADNPLEHSSQGVVSSSIPLEILAAVDEAMKKADSRPAARVEASDGGGIKTLPRPVGWDHEPTINLVTATSVPDFPKTREGAAATFGVDGSTKDPKRWERTAEGDGWHLSEAQFGDDTKDALNVNPRGYLTEGYYDTSPGRNPFCYAREGIDGSIPAQGSTIWNVRTPGGAAKLQVEMVVPKWKTDQGVVSKPCDVISPDNSAQGNEGATSKEIAPTKFPESASEATDLFGGNLANWEKTSDGGGWHLKPQDSEQEISLGGFIMDGYDTEGAFVAGGSVKIKALGGTIWPVTGSVALKELEKAVEANNPGKTVRVITPQ